MTDWSKVMVDVLVIVGTLAMTLAVFGVVRIPDSYAKIHSAGKAVVLSVLLVLGASALTASAQVGFRALAIGGFLLLTAPVGAHALARLARPGRGAVMGPESGAGSQNPSTGEDG